MKTRIAMTVVSSIVAALAGDRLARSQTGPASFSEIARALQSPRCMNCHPSGDAPLQTDASHPHRQNIKRTFSSLGGDCTTCHQETAMPGENMPPGAPHWTMPPADMPMVFQGKTIERLCADLQDPTQNGGRSLEDLVHHVKHDPLVLWAFNPGGGRTTPPMTHQEFVALMTEWAAQGGPCP